MDEVKKVVGKPAQKAIKQKSDLKAKSYRLLNDRAGMAFMLKVGRKGDLLVYDESVGYNRAIKHCPNEKSIFQDEQSDYAIVVPLIFESGYLETKPTEIQTQRFLDAHPDNAINGGGLFEEVNDEKEAQNDIVKEELVLDIKQAIRDKEKEKDGIYALESLTAVLKGSVAAVRDMSKSEMKREIYKFVDENPYRFVDNKGNVNIFDDESVNRKYLTLRAISEGVITVAPNNRSVMWGNDKSVIINVPLGIKPVEHFSDYLSTDEGMLILDEIVKRS